MQCSRGCRHIQLGHFLAGIGIAGIGYGSLYGHHTALGLHTCGTDGKGGIAEAEAKGIGRLHTEGIKVTVAYIDAFLIVFVVQIPIEIAELIGEGNVCILLGPGIGQLAAGCHIAADHVRKGMAALGTQLTQVQNGIDSGDLLYKGHIDGAAAVDDQQELFIMISAEGNGFLLRVGQEHISLLCLSVAALACLTAQHIDAGIGAAGCHILIGNGAAHRCAEIIEKHLHDGIGLQDIDPLFLFDLVGSLFLGIELLKIFDPAPGGDLESPVVQSFQNGDGMAFVDLAGAGAAFDGHRRTGAVEGDLLRFEGQSPVVFQQDHSLAGSLVGNVQVVHLPLGHIGAIAGFRQ